MSDHSVSVSADAANAVIGDTYSTRSQLMFSRLRRGSMLISPDTWRALSGVAIGLILKGSAQGSFQTFLTTRS
jgi:hypothetical protein